MNLATEKKLTKRVAQSAPKAFDDGLIKATRELEEANKELEAFCYAVSHDLRAPLRRASNFCEAALENLENDNQYDAVQYVSRACSTMSNMNQLINDLLQLSKTQRQALNPVEFDLSIMVDEITAQLSESFEHEVKCIIQDHVWAVADKGLLRIVLENLLANAWKYTGKTEKAQVVFGASNFQGKNVYYVRDNGAGFNMQYAFKLFSPFQRLHTQKEFEGTGIGLATVKRIIRRHGGGIWAESTVGKGATFYFTLD